MQPNQTSIPTAVLRKWKAAFEPDVPKEPKPSLKDTNTVVNPGNRPRILDRRRPCDPDHTTPGTDTLTRVNAGWIVDDVDDGMRHMARGSGARKTRLS